MKRRLYSALRRQNWLFNAGMAELVDALVSGTKGISRVGSSPTTRTTMPNIIYKYIAYNP